MGIFGKLASLFGGGKKSGKSAVKTFLVDGARLLDEKTGRRLSPREQLALIGALGRLAKQEEFAMSVIFETDRPLREAPDGGEYQGVTVWYAATAEELIEKALKTARRTGVTLVTSGPNLESRATEEKVSLLSSGTFKKAFLTGFSFKDDGRGRGDRGDRGERGGGGNGSGRHERRHRDRGGRRGGRGGGGGNGGGNGANASGGGEGGAAAPEGNNGGGEGAAAPSDGTGNGGDNGNGGGNGGVSEQVRNLIDLVE